MRGKSINEAKEVYNQAPTAPQHYKTPHAFDNLKIPNKTAPSPTNIPQNDSNNIEGSSTCIPHQLNRSPPNQSTPPTHLQ